MKRIKSMVNSYLKRVNKNFNGFIDKNNWSHLDNSFKKRKYSSYDDYVSHQKSKLMLKNKEKSLKNNHNNHVKRFYQRFHDCEYIKRNNNVLCLGARTGAEVEAFRKLGCFATGIDLNPGIDNPFVMYGDFHDLLFPEDSVDIIYCNCLDHLFDIDEVLKEIVRVLKNEGGVFILDVVAGFEDEIPHNVDGFDCFHWEKAEDFVNLISKKSELKLKKFRNLNDIGTPKWNQAILIK